MKGSTKIVEKVDLLEENVEGKSEAEVSEDDYYHNSHSIYDDIFKTLATRRSKWLIPLINEVFFENFSEDASVKLMNETHYVKRKDESGSDNSCKIMTDCIFTIDKDMFHLELQSTYDGSMIIRVIEYDFVSAMEQMTYFDKSRVEVELPNSAVIYLRPHKKIPDEYEIIFKSGNESMVHKVKVVKFNEYTIEEMFNKKLFILLPFYIIRYDKALGENKIDLAEESLNEINKLLLENYEDGIIYETDYTEIVDLIKRIIRHLTHKGKKQERLAGVMKGEIIETTTSKYEEARAKLKSTTAELETATAELETTTEELKTTTAELETTTEELKKISTKLETAEIVINEKDKEIENLRKIVYELQNGK